MCEKRIYICKRLFWNTQRKRKQKNTTHNETNKTRNTYCNKVINLSIISPEKGRPSHLSSLHEIFLHKASSNFGAKVDSINEIK
jgi:hypothetical protein